MTSAFCLICSKIVEHSLKGKRGRKPRLVTKQRNAKKFQLLLNYLLATPTNEFSQVKEGVLKQVVFENGESIGNIRFCGKCDLEVEYVLKMHLQLEKVQMKLIHKLVEIKEVIRSGGGVNKSEDEGEQEIADECVKTLVDFREAVGRKGQASVHIPVVYLEKYSFLPERQWIFVETDEPAVVKTEHDLGPIGFDDQEPFPEFDFSPLEFTSEQNTTNSKSIDADLQEIKTEVKETHSPSRKSALIASTRISNTDETNEALSSKLATVKKRKLKSKSAKEPRPKRVRKRIRRPYTCNLCDFSCRTICPYEEHLRTHEVEDKPLTCQQCPSTFSTQQYLDFHTRRHDGKHRLECDTCMLKIPAFEMVDHMKSHVPEVFPCPCCAQICSSNENLMIHHSRSHFSKAIECGICSKQFEKRSELLKHLDLVHKAIGKLKCDFEGCNKEFYLPSSLKNHQISHSSRFCCRFCGKGFTNQFVLDIHEKVHKGIKAFQCDQCSLSFTAIGALKAHKKQRHNNIKFKCDVCGMEFDLKMSLKRHKILMHGEPGGKSCGICNQIFYSASKLADHMDRKHSSGSNYICDECGMSLKTKQTYRQHKLTHGERTEKCSYCDSAFTTKKCLILHERIHTGEKPYLCVSCGKAFNQKCSLNAHQRKCGDQRLPS